MSPAFLGARGAIRALSAWDTAGWTPPTTGRELTRAMLIGTGGDAPVLVLAITYDVDPRRLIVFVQFDDFVCAFRPTGHDLDALEVALPFRLGTRLALAVVVECTTEGEAEELARRYEAVRADLEAAAPEEPHETEEPQAEEPQAEEPHEAEEPQAEEPRVPGAAPSPEGAEPPPVMRSAPPPPPPPPAPSFPAPSLPTGPAPPSAPVPAPSAPAPQPQPTLPPGEESAERPALAHVHAEMPRRVAVDTDVEVRFRLSRRRLEASAGTSHAAQAIRVDPERDLTVTIALRGFRLVDDQPETISTRLPRSAEEVAEHRFRLVAPLQGRGEVSLVVRQDADLPLATLRLTAEIVPAGRSVEPVATAEVTADVVAPDPDLVVLPSIRVDESIVGNDSTLRIRVAIAGEARECTTRLADKAAYISRTYRRISGIRSELGDLPDRDERARHGLRRLRALGMGLARSLFDDEVLALLWNAANAASDEPGGLGALDGLIVQTSGELDLPWEIVHLVPPARSRDDGKPRFLSSYGLTRWVYDTPHPTELHVARERVRYVCPDYVEQRLRLTHSTEERHFLEHRFAAKTIDPDDADGMAGLMHDGFDLLHFAGHGRWSDGSPQLQELLLSTFREDEDVPRARYSDDRLRHDLPDRGATDAADTGPFVFLNACDIGRLPSGPASLGGFPEAFLRGGAAAFVGCSWAVGDDPASTFVEAFYLALADDDATVADAARIARRAARDDADLSELAYAVYAHPRARIRLDPPAPEGPPS